MLYTQFREIEFDLNRPRDKLFAYVRHDLPNWMFSWAVPDSDMEKIFATPNFGSWCVRRGITDPDAITFVIKKYNKVRKIAVIQKFSFQFDSYGIAQIQPPSIHTFRNIDDVLNHLTHRGLKKEYALNCRTIEQYYNNLFV